MAIELKVPAVGESITEVMIGEWLKSEGDRVEQDDVLVIIETDKVNVELPAPQAGVLAKILKKDGEDATVGEVIGHLEAGDGAAEATEAKAGKDSAKKDTAKKDTAKKDKETPVPANADNAAESDEPMPVAETEAEEEPESEAEEEVEAEESGDDEEAPEDAEEAKKEPRVMPAARRQLAEAGLAASDVKATGPGGRLLKEDVQRHVQEQGKQEKPAPAAPAETTPAAARAGTGGREEEVVKMTPLRRRVAQRLVEAQQTAALLTTFNEIDMSRVMELRQRYQESFLKKYEIKLGFMSFFVKAVVEALKEIPQVNAEIRGDDLVYRNYYDIGVAVGGGKGLVVPVIRNAERLSFAEVEKTIADLGARARDNKLKLEELQGGTFTLSNGGIYGSLLSTPIVNPPQSGILGMHAIQERPVAIGGQVVVRPMMYVALTYDHRVVDGREAVTFLVRVKERIEDPTRILLEV